MWLLNGLKFFYGTYKIHSFSSLSSIFNDPLCSTSFFPQCNISWNKNFFLFPASRRTNFLKFFMTCKNNPFAANILSVHGGSNLAGNGQVLFQIGVHKEVFLLSRKFPYFTFLYKKQIVARIIAITLILTTPTYNITHYIEFWYLQ